MALVHALITAAQALGPTSENDMPRKRRRRTIKAPPRSVSTASRPVLEYTTPPDIHTFERHCTDAAWPHGRPFVVRHYAHAWPALVHWQDPAYLLRRAGPGRHVPVEHGRTYTDAHWGQSLWPWAAFLAHIRWGRASAPSAPTLYLAQHTLLTQFPWLAEDVTVPTYAVHGPQSSAAHGRASPVVQVWMGPAGTTSPAHTDPYLNCYVQVVGHKLVWLAPPRSHGLCVYGGPDDKDLCTRHMSNTSQVDVFQPRAATPAAFRTHVVPHAESVYLHPGDLLFVPPGWWHAMQSTTQSCSVSFWF
ncbi:[histone H3]-dimethyl-L-lysine(36) demethylase [Malassezia equina]|uniref:[histone H3]-dimethyl-L-lysine(36) demethylase n=1 Tax=Malassezia equina TaxID=1381935 RepID=A0AAF0IYJ9_9BASI|nr:[histone H3]-dimethyl-L-lysine(36) demethylase [Malassezia equina]